MGTLPGALQWLQVGTCGRGEQTVMLQPDSGTPLMVSPTAAPERQNLLSLLARSWQECCMGLHAGPAQVQAGTAVHSPQNLCLWTSAHRNSCVVGTVVPLLPRGSSSTV